MTILPPLAFAAAHGSSSFASVVALVSGVVATLGAILAAVQAVVMSSQLRTSLRQLRETTPEAVVQPLDFDAIGTYLYETVGGVTLEAYAKRGEAHQDVVRSLSEVEDFLDRDVPQAADEGDRAVAGQLLDGARQALRAEDTWTALARLRRSVEMELRAMFAHVGLPVPERASAHQLLTAAKRSQLLPGELVDSADSAIATANLAVHGIDVPYDEAQQALANAEELFSFLREATS